MTDLYHASWSWDIRWRCCFQACNYEIREASDQVKFAVLLLARPHYVYGFWSLQMTYRNAFRTHPVFVAQWLHYPVRWKGYVTQSLNRVRKSNAWLCTASLIFTFILNWLNVAIEWLAILVCIQEDPSSDLHHKCGSPYWDITLYPLLLPKGAVFVGRLQAVKPAASLMKSGRWCCPISSGRSHVKNILCYLKLGHQSIIPQPFQPVH